MGGFSSAVDAYRMVELMVARGYDLVYGFGDKTIKGLGDLLASRGCEEPFDPYAIIEIVPDTPLTIPACTCRDWGECIDIMSEEQGF